MIEKPFISFDSDAEFFEQDALFGDANVSSSCSCSATPFEDLGRAARNWGDVMQFRDPASGKSFVRKVRRTADEPGCAYELTFCCYHRYRFLEKDRVRGWFVDAMLEARKRLKFDLWADVIMPEHVHLLVYPGESGALAGQIRGKIKELAARPAIAFLAEHAPGGVCWR